MAYVKCKFLKVEPRSDGKVVPRSGEPYLCLWEAGPIVLPASATLYDILRKTNTEIVKTRVGKEDCASCPCFESE